MNFSCSRGVFSCTSCVAAAVAALVFVSGCGSKSDPVKSTATATAAAKGTEAAQNPPANQDRCAGLLTNALDMIQPERLGISSPVDNSIGMLNEWLSSCGAVSGGNTSDSSIDAATEHLLTPEQKKVLQEKRIDARDIEHIRDCIIDRKAMDVLAKGSADDLDRIVRLFYYVTRNVTIVPPSKERMLTTPYETLMFGRGTAEDRAWIFAKMLRQLRIDAVILQPAFETAASSGAVTIPTPSSQQPAAPTIDSKATDAKKSTGNTDKPAEKKPTGDIPGDKNAADANKPGAGSEQNKSQEATGATSRSEKPQASDPAAGNKTAAAETKPTDKPWLVGVLLNNQVYLFDMQLGWPIPSPADNGVTAVVRSPATLREALADDSIFRRLDLSADRPYQLHSSDLKSLHVELISDVRSWTARLRGLQLQMPLIDNRAVVIYDIMNDVGTGKGLVTRAVEGSAGAWNRGQFSLWPYPEACAKAAQHRDHNQMEAMKIFWLPYQATSSVEFDQKILQVVIGTPNRAQLKTRISHLTGEYASAIKSYLAIQLAEHPPRYVIPQKAVDAMIDQAKTRGTPTQQVPRQFEVPQDVFYMHARAAEDAKYWIALAQFELGDYHAAVDSFENYQKRYGGKGSWAKSVAVGRAVAQAEDKQLAVAAYTMTRLLEAIPDDDPQRAGLELLAVRWRAAHQALKNEAKGEAGK